RLARAAQYAVDHLPGLRRAVHVHPPGEILAGHQVDELRGVLRRGGEGAREKEREQEAAHRGSIRARPRPVERPRRAPRQSRTTTTCQVFFPRRSTRNLPASRSARVTRRPTSRTGSLLSAIAPSVTDWRACPLEPDRPERASRVTMSIPSP